jgi:hexosaminidase
MQSSAESHRQNIIKMLLLSLYLIGTTFSNASIIPAPAKMESLPGSFTLNADTKIIYSEAAKAEAEMLASLLRPATGFPLQRAPMQSDYGNAIVLELHHGNAEGYTLVAASDCIRITASTPAGWFYGGQTLRQLLPPALFATTKQTGVKWQIPACKIEDQPRFHWRGFMIDSSRHFQTTNDIKHWLDLLAMHKMNVFHWHLVDDHGWRFESKKYPLLTQVGAWREQPPIGRYGGFYTQAEMRDIVAYAAARHITVVPEIEMPGHSRAALAAYPNLACGGTKTEVDHFFDFPMNATRFPAVPGNNVFCAGNPATYRFLADVLTEVMAIFPSEYIHVGGDEVDMDYWNNCADCKAMMKKNNLATGHKLQAHLMERMEKFLNAHGRKMIGWDDILVGGLSPNVTVMSWRGTDGGIAAAKSGHDAVMSPGKPLYFDHRQSPSPLHPPGFGSAVETLEEVYNYDPVPKELSTDQAKHILGAQANLWTCATPDKERLELFAFPRLCALAEIEWSPASPKDFPAFQKRLTKHLQRLDVLGVNYWREPATSIKLYADLQPRTDINLPDVKTEILSPHHIVVKPGIESLRRGASVADVAAGIETVCLRLHKEHPAAELLLLGILPCRDVALAAKVDRVNFQLETRLQPQRWVHVLDLGNKFRKADGVINPHADGNEIVKSAVKNFEEQNFRPGDTKVGEMIGNPTPN